MSDNSLPYLRTPPSFERPLSRWSIICLVSGTAGYPAAFAAITAAAYYRPPLFLEMMLFLLTAPLVLTITFGFLANNQIKKSGGKCRGTLQVFVGVLSSIAWPAAVIISEPLWIHLFDGRSGSVGF